MVYRALHVSFESRRVMQPVLTADGLLVAWDGRLDNREALQRQLGLPVEARQPDINLIVKAYRRWPERFLSSLVGDFALALWDGRRRRLYLARDALAGRPIFFTTKEERILWASTIRALFASGEVAPDIDDDWVAAYIIETEPAGHSPFTTIKPVPPGSAIIFTPEGRSEWRFWEPTRVETIRYLKDEDYEEAFRELLFDSVRCRLRARGAVFAELSGGIDSSSIVCVANRLIERGDVEATELYTQSWVYDRASEADEREFIEIVENETGRTAFHLREDDYPVLAGFERVRPQAPNGFQIWPAGFRRTVELLRENSSRVLLSGFAGDQLTWSQMEAPWHLADSVVHLQFLKLLADLGLWHREAGHPYPFLLWEGVWKPLWRSARGRSNHEPRFDWLSERLRARTAHLMARAKYGGKRLLSPSLRIRAEAILGGVNGRSWLFDEIEHGVEIRYPFLHLPLVEFCLAIPFEQLVRPHEMRSVHRRALHGILPETIRSRECKRSPRQAIMHGFRREWPRIAALFTTAEAHVYERGYVQRERFVEELQRIWHGLYGDYTGVLRVLQVEVWLRSVDKKGGLTATPRSLAARA